MNKNITQFHSCSNSLYWHGCYGSDTAFKKYITPESYSHPAKASFLLMDRIFKHLKILGLLNKGDTICDFMAGSGRTNIVASLHGFDSVAVELEPHFIKMIQDNIALAKKQINRNVNVQIVQGDSRKLSEILGKANIGIVSPPYSNRLSDNDQREFMDKEGKHKRPNTSYTKHIGIVSPPYQDISVEGGVHRFGYGNKEKHWSKAQPKEFQHKYSSNPSNIGNLKDKQLIGITSPPYGNSEIAKGNVNQPSIEDRKQRRTNKEWSGYSPNPSNIGNLPDKNLVGITSPPYGLGEGIGHSGQPTKMVKAVGLADKIRYGNTKGNIGNLPNKQLIGITSPPYENAINTQNDKAREKKKAKLLRGEFKTTRPDVFLSDKNLQGGGTSWTYNPSQENLGNQQGESYLSAMLQVYREAAKVMPVLVTVTKNPTRKGQLRRLDLDTAKLLQLAGYRIVDYHQAVLFDERKQLTLKGDIKKELKGRLSFFKRLSIQKGNIAAQFEDILFAVKA